MAFSLDRRTTRTPRRRYSAVLPGEDHAPGLRESPHEHHARPEQTDDDADRPPSGASDHVDDVLHEVVPQEIAYDHGGDDRLQPLEDERSDPLPFLEVLGGGITAPFADEDGGDNDEDEEECRLGPARRLRHPSPGWTTA